MTPEQLADISARAYQHMRPWSATDFSATLARPISLLTHTDHAFVLGQVIVDEAEILALATDPDHQDQGHAHRALAMFEAQALARGAQRIFLEVARKNTPAQRFYTHANYTQAGVRSTYYTLADGTQDDALILNKQIQ